MVRQEIKCDFGPLKVLTFWVIWVPFWSKIGQSRGNFMVNYGQMMVNFGQK